MQFNNSSTNQGICQDTRFLLGFGVNDTATYPTADIARNGNNWYRRAVNDIWETVGDWEYDDTNATTLPNATTDLVAGQADYGLPSNAQKIERVEVMDDEGEYHELKPFTKEMITDRALTEIYDDNGMPEIYDMVGRSVVLYPSPSADETTLTAGLKIYVSRDIDEFYSTTTTREPGFANNFHRIISLGAALDYALGKGLPDKISIMNNQLTGDPNKPNDKGLIGEMKEFYARRHERDFKLHISPKTENFI